MTPDPSNRSNGRPPTLREIADQAGVHISTASRVLRQPEPADGWSDSALRVRQVAEELGYQPNLWAASLRTRKTTTIGVVMPRLTDVVVATMFQGIEEAATAAGYSVLLSSPPDDLDAQRKAVEFLVSRQVDGLMLSSIHLPGTDFVDSLPLRSLPILLLNRHIDSATSSPNRGLPFVSGDDRLGGYLAGKHLLDCGYRDLGVIAGPDHASTSRERVAGFRDALTEAGLELPPNRIVASEFEVQGGVDAAATLLGGDSRPDAVFTVSDTIAIGVLGVARDLGLSIPDDLALVGYNDIPVVSQLPVPLTTVRSPARKIGATGLEHLLALISGKNVESVKLPVELIVRASTRKPASRKL
ncbi:LacI family DNA-binding transcriptional regulator [Rhodococcus erythropolis]|jgi:LacI family transcriptional regulator|uniref:LacI family DNA-binding transcriptional regulator n=1 Tax=Rhodococcus erythropolis TaxID=1833 RepID=A0A1F2PX83_RHOER|nr:MULTISPECIES: LacI family DNA-binding transcriptional regulator [Rhodococcus]ERB50561.1 LacI family transcription regulator [Rhodococcus sp. P27]AGT94413.1 LacI family transcriptional regulator [Rhodococcus erythropolis CCM2595]ALU69347.1 LacI family transcriptional regulator [Rhodococcus erythropolis R138]EQM34395.1 LacI family transcription regulator [Rhodococcus erythropolis DN1]MBH5145196.1 LacI family DNA-binding transcriptional regulator [Rhodococcus erythropolis]